MKILVEHVGSNDLPVILYLNVKCSVEQLENFIDGLDKKDYINNIFKDDSLSLFSLKQKIIILSTFN